MSVLFIRTSADLFRDFEPSTVIGQRPRWRRFGSTPPEWRCDLSYFRAFFFTQGRSMTTLSTLARPFSLPPMRHWFFAVPHHPQLNAFYCLLARLSRPNPLSIYLFSRRRSITGALLPWCVHSTVRPHREDARQPLLLSPPRAPGLAHSLHVTFPARSTARNASPSRKITCLYAPRSIRYLACVPSLYRFLVQITPPK